MTSPILSHFLIPASDGTLLPSLLYKGGVVSKKLAVFVHGSGSSSIIRDPEILHSLAATLGAMGVDVLAFNNRGAGYITKFTNSDGSSIVGGMAYELIEEFHLDISGVLDWAKQQHYTSLYLIGHSTGANKLAIEMSRYSSDIVKGVALLAGGDDVTLQRSVFNAARLGDMEQVMEKKIAEGKGRELMSETFYATHPLSWRSFKELISRGGPYDVFPFGDKDSLSDFSVLKKIKAPTLYVYGSNDFGTAVPPAEAVKRLQIELGANANIIEGADHGFHGLRDELSGILANWISDIN